MSQFRSPLNGGFSYLVNNGKPKTPEQWALLIGIRANLLEPFMDAYPISNLGSLSCLFGREKDDQYSFNSLPSPLKSEQITQHPRLSEFSGLALKGIFGILRRNAEGLDPDHGNGLTELWGLTRKKEWLKIGVHWQRRMDERYFGKSYDAPQRMTIDLVGLDAFADYSMISIWITLGETVSAWKQWAEGLYGLADGLNAAFQEEKVVFDILGK